MELTSIILHYPCQHFVLEPSVKLREKHIEVTSARLELLPKVMLQSSACKHLVNPVRRRVEREHNVLPHSILLSVELIN